MTARWAYRVGQVAAAHRARLDDADRAEALSNLTPELGRLFLGMAVRDQEHALRVLRRLGDADASLRQAALLHDVGKTLAPLGTPGRSLVVLARARGSLAMLCRVPLLGRRVRRYVSHPAIGAEMLRAAGADQSVIEIVAEHQSARPALAATARLQAIDAVE